MLRTTMPVITAISVIATRSSISVKPCLHRAASMPSVELPVAYDLIVLPGTGPAARAV